MPRIVQRSRNEPSKPVIGGAPGLAMVAIATLMLASCGEIPQDAAKPFAGKEETRSYAGGQFNGDKALYEKTLAGRADTMNEYLITQDAKTEPTSALVAAEATGPAPAAAVK